MNKYLEGYKFGVVWEGESKTEEFTIVASNADISKNEVNINTGFAKSIIGKNKGDICISNQSKFQIKYIICPNFAELCKKRNIKYLYHFSAIENVDSIMKYGILSVNKLKNNNIKYDFNDNERYDKRYNCISCSVEFPNGILLNNFKNKFNKKYVIFRINIDVLNYKYALCCPTNAATCKGDYIVGIDKFVKLYEGERFDLPNSFPTSEQAEILIFNNIEPKYIEQIIFETKQDELLFQNKYNTYINANLFKYRNAFLKNIRYIN